MMIRKLSLGAFFLGVFILSIAPESIFIQAIWLPTPDFRPQIDPGFAPDFLFQPDMHELDSKAQGLMQKDTGHFAAKKEAFVCPFPFGKFPNPEDCASYYNCHSGRPSVKKCRKGQRFDKNKRKCVAESEAQCAEKDDNDEYKKIDFDCPYPFGPPHTYPKNCAKYYLCLFGNAYLKTCEDNKLYDEKQRKCQDKTKVDCGSRYNPYDPTTTISTTTKKTKPPGESTVPITTTPDIGERTTTANPTISPDYEETTSPTASKSTASVSTDVSDETTGSTITMTTASTYETTTSEILNKTDTTTISSTETTSDFISTQDPILNFVCPKKTGMFPVQSDCSKYISCRKSIPTLKECEDDTLFHEDYGFCYNAKEVDCGQRKRPDKSGLSTDIDGNDGTSSSSPTSDSTSPSTISSTPDTPSCEKDDETCAIDDNTGKILRCPEPDGLFPHPTDRKQFIQCVHMKIYIHHCPRDLVFDPKLRVCAWSL